MVHSSSEFKCIRTYLGTLVQVIIVQNCLSQLKPALFQFCVRMDTAVIQYILNQKTLCRFMIRNSTMRSAGSRARTILCALFLRASPCAECVFCSTETEIIHKKIPVLSSPLRISVEVYGIYPTCSELRQLP